MFYLVHSSVGVGEFSHALQRKVMVDTDKVQIIYIVYIELL